MYISIKDGQITPVDKLPDLSNLPPLNGLHYCDGETSLPNGRKSFHWQKCELFSDEKYSPFPMQLRFLNACLII